MIAIIVVDIDDVEGYALGGRPAMTGVPADGDDDDHEEGVDTNVLLGRAIESERIRTRTFGREAANSVKTSSKAP